MYLASSRHVRKLARLRPPVAKGFSLLELMIAVAILAIVASIALPNLKDMINRSRLSSATNEWLSVIQIARLEAVRRNARVVICPSSAGTSCDGTSWNRVVAFVDSNRDGALGGGEVIVREHETNPLVLVSVSPAISGSTPANRITMRADGLAHPGDSRLLLEGKIGMCVTALPVLNARRVAISGSRVSVDIPAVTAANCAAPTNT